MRYAFLNTNSKGQIVIPKFFRDSVGMREGVPLLVKVVAGSIYLKPVEEGFDVTTKSNNEVYLEILKKTKGKWGMVEEDSDKDLRMKKKEQKDYLERSKSW